MSATNTEEVTRILREHIMSGHIRPGQKLQQIPLAEALGVSRTPLRTALANLTSEGLLNYESNCGYRVREFPLSDVIAAYEVRAQLEGLAAASAARHGLGRSDIETLDECLATGDRLLSAGVLLPADLDPYRGMNVLFHDTIIRAACNRWIADFVRQTQNIPFASNRLIIWQHYDIMLRSHDDHHRVREAIVERDPQRASAIMREHVGFAGKYLQRCVASTGEFIDSGYDPGSGDASTALGEHSEFIFRSSKEMPL